MAIMEKQGDEHGAALTYGHLGYLARMQGDISVAEQWFRKALAIWVKYGDKHNEAITRNNLAIMRVAAWIDHRIGGNGIPSSRVKPPWARFLRWVRGQLP